MLYKSGLGLAILLVAAHNVVVAAPAVWVTPIKGGEMRFYDWGYEDTLNGRRAFDFAAINGGFGGLQKVMRPILLVQLDKFSMS